MNRKILKKAGGIAQSVNELSDLDLRGGGSGG